MKPWTTALLVSLAGCSAQPAKPQPGPAASGPAGKPAPAAEVALTEAQQKRACECGAWDLERQMNGVKLSPAEAKDACITNVDCVLTFATLSDCSAVVECARGEPGRMPTCRPGYAMQPMNQCLKKCPDGACPSGEACDKDPTEPLCRPK